MILRITGQNELLDSNPVIQKSIFLRNPYTDVLNLLQVELIKRYRAAEQEETQGCAAAGPVPEHQRHCGGDAEYGVAKEKIEPLRYLALCQRERTFWCRSDAHPDVGPEHIRYRVATLTTMRAVAALALFLFTASCIPPETGKSPPPNIIVILADDLGYNDIGSFGSKIIHTPHLDALAQGGVRLTNGYVSAAVCSPSRARASTPGDISPGSATNSIRPGEIRWSGCQPISAHWPTCSGVLATSPD